MQETGDKKSLIVLVVMSSVFILIMSSAFLWQRFGANKTAQDANNYPIGGLKQVTPTESPYEGQQITLVLGAQTENWQVGNEYQVNVAFAGRPEIVPTVYTLQLVYDKDIATIVDIAPGGVWTENQILQKEIKNEMGQAVFSVGKGFSAQDVPGIDNLAVVTFMAKNKGEFQLTLGPESALANSGKGRKFTTLPLKLAID